MNNQQTILDILTFEKMPLSFIELALKSGLTKGMVKQAVWRLVEKNKIKFNDNWQVEVCL